MARRQIAAAVFALAVSAPIAQAQEIDVIMTLPAPTLTFSSAFIAEDTDDLLKKWCIWQLFSPPRTPSYNGSAEAGIGSMRTRTHHQAARHGHAGEWTCNDVEAARLEANETARPWGHHGPTPDEVWQGRALIGIEERMAFGMTGHAEALDAMRLD
mgnify:CR=1 FL=1